MQKTFIAMSIAALFGFTQASMAGESQNPHDAVNQPREESQDPSDTGNQFNGVGGTGSATGNAGAGLDRATNAPVNTPNPNSLGRTGRFDELDAQNQRRNPGIQTPPRNSDNLSDRTEDTNNSDRQLRDRLDGSPVPTADPGFNSGREGQAPIPPGQGPAVNPDATTNSTSTIRSDTGAGSSSTNSRSSTNSGTSTSGSSGRSGSGTASGSGSSGASSGAGGAR